MAITIYIPPARTLLGIFAGIFVLGAAYATYDLQPIRQLGKAQARLITAVEARNWKRVGEIVSENYHDSFSMDKSIAIDTAQQIFANFLVLGVDASVASVTVNDRSGTVTAVLRITGSGNVIAQTVITEVNATQTPFTFQWQQQSWKPWDWKLTEVQPAEELRSTAGRSF